MPRPTSRQPTDGELEILKVLWDRGPCELGMVCGALRQQRDVATTTVATMLKVMLEKKMVKRAKGPRGYQWSTRVTPDVTRRRLLRKLMTAAFDGSARGLVTHLVEDGELSPEDIEEIRHVLDQAPRRPSKKRRSHG